MDAGEVAKLLKVKPFSDFDPDRFPSNLPLAGILQNDTRLRRLKQGQFVVREGDYGNSAFLVLSGEVRVILDQLPLDLLGRSSQPKPSILKRIARSLKASPYVEARPFSGRRNIRGQAGDPIFLQDFPRILEGGKRSAVMGKGELFGELAALGRTRRVATVVAEHDDTELLEIRWQGLRDIGRFAPEWQRHIEEMYREHGLSAHLKASSPMDRLDAATQGLIAEQTRFVRFGGFDWHHEFKQQSAKADAAERLKSEPVVLKQGDYLNGLCLIQSGFVRVSQKYNYGEKTISYLGKGQSFGLRELCYNSLNERPIGSQATLRAQGYVDVLIIPTHLVEDHILPVLTKAEKRELVAGLGFDPGADDGRSKPRTDSSSSSSSGSGSSGVAPEMVEFLLDHRTINGTATMLIDLNRCTRCDDCVRACASTHDNNPRFIRHGPAFNGIQVTNACMHCVDPVCMLECPTGAIHRNEDGGQILINDFTCIGCAMCANSCPYDNIQMVTISGQEGRPQYPLKLDADGQIVAEQPWREPFRKATKCDLCADQPTGPACVNACPHDALTRADMRDVDSLASWLKRS